LDHLQSRGESTMLVVDWPAAARATFSAAGGGIVTSLMEGASTGGGSRHDFWHSDLLSCWWRPG